MSEHLDKFGAFVVGNIRDRMHHELKTLMNGSAKSPDAQVLQEKLSNFSESERETIGLLGERIISSGLHDFLFSLQEEADSSGVISVVVDGVDVAKKSDGLHGELFGDDGWIARFSAFPEPDQG